MDIPNRVYIFTDVRRKSLGTISISSTEMSLYPKHALYKVSYCVLIAALRIKVSAAKNELHHGTNHICNVEDHATKLNFVETISYDDRVQEQYAAYPYPPFNQDMIINEIHHYRTLKSQVPRMMPDGIQPEHINHFLFRGGETFG